MSKRIKLVTERDVIKSVAERWKDQYQFDDGRWASAGVTPGNEVYAILRSLDLETTTAAKINSLLGNDSWTTRECLSCLMSVKTCISFNGRHICIPCVRKGAVAAGIIDPNGGAE